MTQSKIKAMQTALLKYNKWARHMIAHPEEVEFDQLHECLERGEEALKVELSGKS